MRGLGFVQGYFSKGWKYACAASGGCHLEARASLNGPKERK